MSLGGIPTPITPQSLDAARRLISNARAVDLRATPIEELIEVIRPLVKGYMVEAPVWEPGLELFRASTRFVSPPARLADLWHPPAALCSNGRANREGRPILYCSADIGPLFFELHAEVGTRLTIVKLETTRKMVANRVGYTPEVFSALKSARAVPNYGAMSIDRYSDVGRMINDFLAEVFCQAVPATESWRYRLSAAVSELLLGERKEPINALMYPTVPMWGNVDNFAIRSAFAKAHLRPTYAKFVVVTGIALPEMSFDVLDEARRFDDDGTIHWLGHLGTWDLGPGRELKMTAMRGGYWVATDQNGNVVDPK